MLESQRLGLLSHTITGTNSRNADTIDFYVRTLIQLRLDILRKFHYIFVLHIVTHIP